MVISENLAAVLNDDDGSVRSNANLSFGAHVFTFDYVYDQVKSSSRVLLRTGQILDLRRLINTHTCLMPAVRTRPRKRSTTTRPGRWWRPRWRATTPRSSPTARRGRARRIPWRATTPRRGRWPRRTGASSQGPSSRSSGTLTTTPGLGCAFSSGHPTYRQAFSYFIMIPLALECFDMNGCFHCHALS
jgi:hypothetical protein